MLGVTPPPLTPLVELLVAAVPTADSDRLPKSVALPVDPIVI